MPGKDSDFKIIVPPETMKIKAERPGGKTRAQALEAAGSVVEQSRTSYLETLRADVDGLEATADRLLADAFNRPAHYDALYRKAHDVWGAGSTFDYHLVTAIGSILCDYLEHLEAPSALNRTVIKLHADALRAVIARDVRGFGTQDERELVIGLRKVVDGAAKGR